MLQSATMLQESDSPQSSLGASATVPIPSGEAGVSNAVNKHLYQLSCQDAALLCK